MKNSLLAFLIAFALILAGCAAPPPAEPADTLPAAATRLPASPTAPEPTSAPPTPSQPAPAVATPTHSSPTSSAGDASVPATGENRRVFVIVSEESSVAYQVGEVFFNQNNRFNLAVGITQQVNGEVVLDLDAPEQSTVGPVTVDISAFQSDSTRRDNAIRERWLESNRYPIATFTPGEVHGIPVTAKEGETIDFEITGDLTVRDVTRPVVFSVQAVLNGDRLTGTATTGFKMSDFDFSPPDIAGMLKAEDDVRIEFKFVAVPKPS